MPNALMLAFTTPTSPDVEDAYNDWYDDKHLPDVAAIEGVVAATRYRVHQEVETLPGVEAPAQRYLAVYELTATTEEELAQFVQNLRSALESGQADISPDLDAAKLGAALCLPIGDTLVGVSAGPQRVIEPPHAISQRGTRER